MNAPAVFIWGQLHIPLRSSTRAEMYSVLWNVLLDNPVYNAPELDFAWAKEPLERSREVRIVHDAGVFAPEEGHFCKLSYSHESPLGLSAEAFDYITVEDLCSYLYLQELLETRRVWPRAGTYGPVRGSIVGLKQQVPQHLKEIPVHLREIEEHA